QLPLTVVNSHSHFDHVGSNWEFPQVYGYPEAGASRCALAGYPPDFLRPMLEGNSLAKPLPASFDPANYRIPPWKSVPVIPGQVFDLGDRQLEVLYTPGHTDDSIMLL
ncbi:MAG: MBL fold metallo-hydrolase, partial [Clostridiales bacterium]